MVPAGGAMVPRASSQPRAIMASPASAVGREATAGNGSSGRRASPALSAQRGNLGEAALLVPHYFRCGVSENGTDSVRQCRRPWVYEGLRGLRCLEA
jgi:hypothetical protein